MVSITQAAREELVKFFEDKDVSPIRIYLAPGGCSGPRLSLALDKANESDDSFDLGDNLTFVVDKNLCAKAQPITIDMSYAGFVLESSLDLGNEGGCGGGCGGCGSSSSCCGS
ncbi:IscA/HesB family protein [Desulfobaculum bizertense]|uniref:Fe-S cluster assembly iron-binding protein IscA n=1 Tax=Desulfobaculum bizertense DSM 18034 TaxID=1121442 RepID=A0A1T4VU42_9BACT|nr:IscA/HesB family protein [Desulfobaculum bizertense]UIJ38468.1 IscA/HesB family protein [Desulfobaculum bizertense]SKA68365.1 Fe-S cluster assembly iron-binding protein IscA [Desulfobaculum bizertense DSM 18034]